MRPSTGRRAKSFRVCLHFQGGPEDGGIIEVRSSVLVAGVVIHLESARHVYESLIAWNGRARSIRLHHRWNRNESNNSSA